MRRTLKHLLLVGAVTVAGLGFVGAPEAQAAVAAPAVVGLIPPNQWFELYPPLINPAHPTCVDVPNGLPVVGTDIQLFSCHGYDSHGGPQRFEFNQYPDPRNGGAEIYNVYNAMADYCLGPWRKPGEVAVVGCGYGYWTLVPAATGPAGSFYLKLDGNACLAAEDGTGRDHVRVRYVTCRPGDGLQIWALG